MSTAQTWQIESTSSDDTLHIAEKLGKRLRGGEVIELISDLGGGKTTFVRGLVKGAGSPDSVASPTFTISREYQTPLFRIYHFDFYRLSEAGIVADELAEVVGDPTDVTVVEWGEIVHDVLPPDRVVLTLVQTGGTSRRLTARYPSNLRYLFADIS